MSAFTILPPAVAVHDVEHALEVVKELSLKKVLAIDTETTGLSRPRDRAIIISLSDGVNRYALWPQVFPYFTELLENPELKLIMHNANFDQWMLYNSGIHVDRYTLKKHYRVYDTMVMSALVHDDAPHDLKSLSKGLLGIEMVSFEATFGKMLKKHTLSNVLLDPANTAIVANYASLDAYATFKIFEAIKEILKDMKVTSLESPFSDMWEYFVKTEVPFTKVLWHMELTGIKVDKERLSKKGPDLEKEMMEIHRWFCRKTGNPLVKLLSNDQMADLFFGTLGRPITARTDSGKPQLNEKLLKKWAVECEYAKNLLRYRKLNKILGTYVTNLLELIHVDGKIHASTNQAGARTGRLSYQDPNLLVTLEVLKALQLLEHPMARSLQRGPKGRARTLEKILLVDVPYGAFTTGQSAAKQPR